MSASGQRPEADTLLAHLDTMRRRWRPRSIPGEDTFDPLRSIVVHLVEESARHTGHAGILRERIDGATGL